MRRPRSIRTRLLLFTAALLALVAAGQLVFGAFFARSYFLYREKRGLEQAFQQLRAGYTDDPRQLYELLRGWEDGRNVRVSVFREDGRLVYTSRPMHEGYGFQPAVPDLSGLPFSEEPRAVELPGRGWEDSQLCLTGVLEYQGERRYVVLWVMAASVEAGVSVLTRASVYILCAALAVGALAGALLARRIVRPLEQIQRVSRQLSQLDFSARADESVPIRELSLLAGSVNSMAGQLQRAMEELERANRRLQEDVDRGRQLEEMRREFVAGVSHEMKTPLCLLQMYAENLKNNVAGIDKDYYCQTILEETERLSSMVGSMLELSSLENGMARMELRPLDLAALCRAGAERFAPALEGRRLETELEEVCPVLGDPSFLEMALDNLLSNAADHTPEGGTVRVSAVREGGWAALTVANQGAPIPPEQLERVWDSFHKVDKARVRTGQVHAGLGLSIVRSVVQRHGGSCRAENTADGVAFTLRLPLAEEGPQT